MSTKGIYAALSGSLAQSLKMDTIANNIANVNTTGFKKDQQVFNEYLTANEKEQEVIQVPRDPAAIESFYHMGGGDKSFVNAKGTFTDFSQGSMKPTGNKLDLAIDGKGFFEIQTPQGVRLTRAGNFMLNGDGQLVTKDGFQVLMQSEGDEPQDISSRIVTVNGTKELHISEAGEVFEGAQKMGKISMMNVLNPDCLQKEGNNNYGFKANLAPQMIQINNPSLKQGFLETSNVNVVQEMTDMIATQRAFESTQKAIQAFDQMSDKLINVVGKVNP